jgi:hypothetical protein
MDESFDGIAQLNEKSNDWTEAIRASILLQQTAHVLAFLMGTYSRSASSAFIS